MATPQEVAEVQAFLQKYNGEWVSCDDCEAECPSVLTRKQDQSDCLPYHINSICQEAGIPGGIEEHGYDDWLVVGGEDPIYDKITEGTVTAIDFNRLIQEATPESVRDRVRRRTTRNETDRHQDVEGHQQLLLPTFADRIEPKRERADNTQMHGRGKAGHRHSARTQQRTMPKRFAEALEFIQSHVGKPKEAYHKDLQLVEDKYALSTLATKMMSLQNANRDWLYELRSLIR